jgi:hypothetical protein
MKGILGGKSIEASIPENPATQTFSHVLPRSGYFVFGVSFNSGPAVDILLAFGGSGLKIPASAGPGTTTIPV